MNIKFILQTTAIVELIRIPGIANILINWCGRDLLSIFWWNLRWLIINIRRFHIFKIKYIRHKIFCFLDVRMHQNLRVFTACLRPITLTIKQDNKKRRKIIVNLTYVNFHLLADRHNSNSCRPSYPTLLYLFSTHSRQYIFDAY